MSKPIAIFLVGIFLLLVGVAGKSLFWSMFTIKTVRCQLIATDNQLGACPEELINQLNSLQNNSLFWTKIEEQVDQLGLELYQLAGVAKYLPDTLELTFIPTESVYLIQSAPDQTPLRVTATGLLASGTPTTSVPEIRLYDSAIKLEVGQQLDQRLHAVLKNLVAYLKLEQLPVRTIGYYQSGFIVVHLEGDKVAIVDEQLNHSQIKKLQRILAELNQGAIGQPIKEIDLRFNLPVLRTSLTNPG